MATRHERVIIDLDDRFSRPMAGMAASTAMFRKNIEDSGRSTMMFDRTVKDTSPSIDKLSGRLAILGRTATVLGPGLIPVITSLTPAIAGLSSQLGFAAAGAGTAVLAFKGMGDSLKAFRQYEAEPTEQNLAKLNETMQGMGPSARAFVGFLDQIAPRLQTIRTAAQEGMLPGVQDGIGQLLTRVPQVRRIVAEIADTMGDLADSAGGSLASSKWNDFFDFLETHARPTLMELGQTVGHLTAGLAQLWMAMDPFSTDFSQGLLSASAAFEKWATGLSATQGFQDFLAYVRETGPQVMDMLGSLANMLLQIGEAAAPLGGPVLSALTAVSNVIAAIADSDLGTPLLAAASAMSALSLASRGFAGVMESSAVGKVKTLTKDLKTMGSTSVVAWGRAASETEKYAAASERVKTSLRGIGKQAAVAGGLTLAMSGLGDKIGLSNTASLALMGTIAGPWGTAIGGGVGLVMDFAAANNNLTDSIETAKAALANQALGYDQQKAAVDAAKANLESYRGEIAKSFSGPLVTFDPGDAKGRFMAIADVFTHSSRKGASEVKNLENSLHQLPNAVQSSTTAFNAETHAIQGNVTAMRTLRSERIRAANAEINYQASIDDATKAAKENGKTLDITTQKGRANRSALLNMAAAWNNQSDAAKNTRGAHRAAIKAFVDAAVQMGMSRAAARKYAQSLMEIPAKRETKILADAGGAYRVIDGVKMALRNLDGTVSTTYIRTVRQQVVTRKLGGEPGVATGGHITGPGTGTSDSIPAWLSNGEYVIKAAAVDRYGTAMFDKLNAMHYATGGSVKKGKSHRVNSLTSLERAGLFNSFDLNGDIGLKRVRSELASFALGVRRAGGHLGASFTALSKRAQVVSKSYDAHKAALKRDQDTLDKLRQDSGSYRSSVMGNFQGNLFGHGATFALQQLNSQTRDAKAFSGSLATLQKPGGLSRGLYEQLAASGDTRTAAQLASMTPAQLKTFNAAFAANQSAVGSLGNQATDFAYGSRIREYAQAVRVQTAAMKNLNSQLNKLERAIEKGAHGTSIVVHDKSGSPKRTAKEVSRRQRYAGG